ncbi:hypothetical protein MWN34_04125 [Ancylobacter sp. 6x-1]|uniref:Uncharacterized protein n=1 Tax=Ancylobacter crimeensis TaxID=2579147 RepID=A0ABT0D812_9HYPH|nr:hypothetical protein [Ancylobacter crimeensis]MCK0196095.1 hypothetical protein [Ancylobacter crimeensis]
MATNKKKLSPAERARQDRKRADFLHRPLQAGHPYRYVPIWIPYPLAQLVAGIAGAWEKRGRSR